MISMSCITGGGFMKCIPTNRSGRFVAAASEVIEIEEVFDARIAWGASSASSFLKISFFTPSFSTIASIARSAPAQSSIERAGLMRAATASRSAAVSFPFSTSFARVAPSLSTAFFASSGAASATTTSTPACAATCAIPEPICPAPMIAILSIAMSPSWVLKTAASYAATGPAAMPEAPGWRGAF